MLRRNRQIIVAFSVATDAALVLLSYLFSTWLWLDIIADNRNMASLSQFHNGIGQAAILYALLIVLLYALFHLYGERERPLSVEAAAITQCNFYGIVVVAAILFLFKLQDFSRGVLFLFFITSTLSVFMKRFIVRRTLDNMRRKGNYLKHVIVVGGGALARQYIEDIRSHKQYDFCVDGVIAPAPVQGCEHLGGFDALDKYLHSSGVDSVVVALEPDEMSAVMQIVETCERNGTKVSVVPFYNDIIPDRPTIEVIGSSKLINLRSMPLDNIGLAFIKRAFDIVASILLIIITSPLMLVAAVGTRLSSPGPVLFRQKRVGKDKRLFMMLKFRSMRENPESDTAWTSDHDPRRTRFGSFIRKLSIDELPQFINVLRGDMSLVGPRPEIPFFVEKFRKDIPLYMVKHQVRPGITGWAQVNGYRGDTSIEERIRHDIWYIENWSIGLDIRILLRTVFGGWINQEKVAEQKPAVAEDEHTNRPAV